VDEIRKHGEDKELKDEIIRLGKKYAIATPYTSMLVLEDDEPVRISRRGTTDFSLPEERLARRPSTVLGSGVAPRTAPERSSGRPQAVTVPSPPHALAAKTGAAGVYVAERTRDMKESTRVGGDYDLYEHVKHVAGRTFYLKNGVWTDSEYDGKAKTVDVEYGSDAYFDLIGKGGDIGKYLALGTKVIFKFKGTWYRITEPTQ
jgi:hypothetical protein